MFRKLTSSVIARFDSFRLDRSGTSAVEFAFILPIMVVLYFGCVEVSEAVSVNRKVTAVSSAAGDLVAQASTLSNSEMDDIFAAARAIISPYSTGPLKIVISSIDIDEDGNTKVQWSRAENAIARTKGSTVSIPDGLKIEGTTLIMAEVDYVYTSVFADFFAGPIPLAETFYLRPRKVAAVPEPA